jgi:putative ABC transport system ATP-binding protein
MDVPPLELRNVVKMFGEVRALDGVSLVVRPRQLTAIMGPSGSGKSTLLHLAAGLAKPDAGEVLVDGQDIAAMDDKTLTLFRRTSIGLVFQSFNLIPTLAADENAALPLRLGGGKNGDVKPIDRARGLLGDLGLADRADHRPDALSGGEQQRVAIARALVTDPPLVLADEPTGNLDAANGDAVCNLLRELASTGGRAIVMVTHEPSVAAYADRVVVVRDGRIADDFDATDLDAAAVSARYQAGAPTIA